MKNIAILGGGIAGVTATYEIAKLAAAGAPVRATLFEATGRLGGIVETVHRDGFTIECGPDGWVTEKPWARELAEELGLADQVLPSNDAARKTWVLVDGRLRAMPDGMRMMVPADLEALDRSDLFSPAAKRSFREEILRAEDLKREAHAREASRKDESVASFVLRHFGPEVLEKIGAPLLSGVFGGDVSQLSVRSVMAPFVAMERSHGSLILALQSRLRTGTAPPIFTTVQSGLGTLIDRMVSTIPESWVRTRTAVTGLERNGSTWRVTTSAGVQTPFDHVFLAAPVDAAAKLLEPIHPETAGLMRMEATSAIVVALAFSEARDLDLPPGFGFLVPANSGRSLLACTFMHQKFVAASGSRTPPGGRLLRAFFGGASAERLLSSPDETLITLARKELTAILGPLPEPTFAIVRRWPRSLPQYAVGHLHRMAQLDAHVADLPGLTLLGNGYRGVGLPDLIRDARAAARSLA